MGDARWEIKRRYVDRILQHDYLERIPRHPRQYTDVHEFLIR